MKDGKLLTLDLMYEKGFHPGPMTPSNNILVHSSCLDFFKTGHNFF